MQINNQAVPQLRISTTAINEKKPVKNVPKSPNEAIKNVVKPQGTQAGHAVTDHSNHTRIIK